MYKKIALVLFMSLFLIACGGIKADVPETPAALAAQALVEQYITTNVEYDAEGLLALYAEDVFWMDYGGDDGPLTKGTLDLVVPEVMAAEEFKMEFTAYLVTSDGKFAVLQGIYSEVSPLTGKWVEAPFVLVLAFEDGLINREEWYYNDSPLH